MQKTRFVSLLILLCVASAVAAGAPRYFDGKSWWDHIKVLADDNMQGRETGSDGLRRAEAYIVDQLKSAGIEPQGSDGFYQAVKFISKQIIEKHSSAALVTNGSGQPLILGEDAYFNARFTSPGEQINAPLVFAGYGLNVPETGYNDLQGLDLNGKVAVILYGSPANLPSALAAHYQSVAERWKALHAAGAIGMISIPNPASMDIPWSRMSLNRTHATMDLAGEEFHETEGEKLSMTFNPAKADVLFTGTGHNFEELAALGRERKPMPHFPLHASIQAKAEIETHDVESSNVVGVYPGSDPALKTQYVVLSAHADHLGIGEPINGDKIYNGAMDNASGCAVLLDIARSLKNNPARIRRSILFLFVTGEEKGLLGSKYFAAHPTVDPKSIVADLNIDMFLPIVPLKVLTVYGLAESDLGDRLTEVAKSYGIPVQPDPAPLRNIFIRSDQYNFVRHGVPALMIDVGTLPGTREEKIKEEWLHERYHAPSDDLQQPVDLAAAALYEDITRQLVVTVANDSQAPRWKPDSFFRRYAQAR